MATFLLMAENLMSIAEHTVRTFRVLQGKIVHIWRARDRVLSVILVAAVVPLINFPLSIGHSSDDLLANAANRSKGRLLLVSAIASLAVPASRRLQRVCVASLRA